MSTSPLYDRSRPDDDSKTRILRVAAELFSMHGFHAVSIRDIAGRCGVSVSTILYHGGSKQGLLETVLASAFDGDSALVRYATKLDPADINSREAFIAAHDKFIDALVQHAIDFPQTRRLWLRLLLDNPEMFASFENRHTRGLFQAGFGLLQFGREQGWLTASDDRLRYYVAGIDWMLNGYFAGGLVDLTGQRLEPSDPTETGKLAVFLKEFGRAMLFGPTSGAPATLA